MLYAENFDGRIALPSVSANVQIKPPSWASRATTGFVNFMFIMSTKVQHDKKFTRAHDFGTNHLIWISNHAFSSHHSWQLSRGANAVIWQKRPGDILASKFFVWANQVVLCISFLHQFLDLVSQVRKSGQVIPCAGNIQLVKKLVWSRLKRERLLLNFLQSCKVCGNMKILVILDQC